MRDCSQRSSVKMAQSGMASNSPPLAKGTMAEDCRPPTEADDGQSPHPERASGSTPRHPASPFHVIPTMRWTELIILVECVTPSILDTGGISA